MWRRANRGSTLWERDASGRLRRRAEVVAAADGDCEAMPAALRLELVLTAIFRYLFLDYLRKLDLFSSGIFRRARDNSCTRTLHHTVFGQQRADRKLYEGAQY